MNADRIASTVSAVPRLIGSIIALGIGAAFMLFGLSISDIARGPDYLAPIAFGVLFFFAGVFGLWRAFFQLRAPMPRSERPSEGSSEISFDADAAIERYLAQKRSTAEPFAVETVPHPARQVFGRKNTNAARTVDPTVS